MMLTLYYIFVQILEQTASFTLYIINWLVLNITFDIRWVSQNTTKLY